MKIGDRKAIVEVSASWSFRSARKLATVEPSSSAERKACKPGRRERKIRGRATTRVADRRHQSRAEITRPDDLDGGQPPAQVFGGAVDPGEADQRQRHQSDSDDALAPLPGRERRVRDRAEGQASGFKKLALEFTDVRRCIGVAPDGGKAKPAR